MGKISGLDKLLIMSDILTNPKGNIVSNIRINKHANMSVEADEDSSDSADPAAGGDEGGGEDVDFSEGLDDIGGDLGGDEGGDDPMGGGDDDGGMDMGGGGDSSGGGMGGDDSGFKPIDQEKKDIALDPHYVQNRRIALFDKFMELKDSVKDSKDRLSDGDESFANNKPIIEALEEVEEMVTLYIESINKIPHDQSMFNLSKCQALYNHINEKV